MFTAQFQPAVVVAIAVAGAFVQAGVPVGAVAGTLVAVATVMAAKYCYDQWYQFTTTLENIAYSLKQVETTSQVVATRANADEWRQCLSFAAQWHQCSPQAAYVLWQNGLITVPAIPASQWYWKASGQDLAAADQNLADSQLPPQLLQLLTCQSRLSAAYEKHQRHQLGQLVFSDADQSRLATYVGLYVQFRRMHQAAQFGFAVHGQQLNQFLAGLQQSLPDNDELLQ